MLGFRACYSNSEIAILGGSDRIPDSNLTPELLVLYYFSGFYVVEGWAGCLLALL